MPLNIKCVKGHNRAIRVNSEKEIGESIYRGINQINEEPVIFKWHYKMDEISVA